MNEFKHQGNFISTDNHSQTTLADSMYWSRNVIINLT